MFRDCSFLVFVAIGTFVAEPCRPRCALKEHLAADSFCRLTFDVHRYYIRESPFCNMCGAVAGDSWRTRPTKPVVLSLRTRVGDPLVAWTICNDCHEGLRGLMVKNPTVRLTMGHIKDKSKGGDDEPTNLRAVCTNCNEGLQNAALPKPDQVYILSQVRRATIDDQRALLEWLLGKFNLTAKPKPKS